MTGAFRLDRGRIVLGDAVFVYLERAPAPSGPLAPGVVPRPHGVAPAAISPDGAVVAAADRDEAIWLGFQPVDRGRATIVRVRAERAQPLDAVTGAPWAQGIADSPRNHLVVPPDSRLVGIPAADGIRPFTAPERLTILAGSAPHAVTVRLTPPGTFARLTGEQPEPLDPDSAYTGWRAI